jgi:hypothetical protein
MDGTHAKALDNMLGEMASWAARHDRAGSVRYIPGIGTVLSETGSSIHELCNTRSTRWTSSRSYTTMACLLRSSGRLLLVQTYLCPLIDAGDKPKLLALDELSLALRFAVCLGNINSFQAHDMVEPQPRNIDGIHLDWTANNQSFLEMPFDLI